MVGAEASLPGIGSAASEELAADPLDPRLIDAAVVLALLVVTAFPLATRPLTAGQRPSDVWAYLLVAALCVPFAFHRRFPVAAIAVACGALVLSALGRYAAYPGILVTPGAGAS